MGENIDPLVDNPHCMGPVESRYKRTAEKHEDRIMKLERDAAEKRVQDAVAEVKRQHRTDEVLDKILEAISKFIVERIYRLANIYLKNNKKVTRCWAAQTELVVIEVCINRRMRPCHPALLESDFRTQSTSMSSAR